MKLYDIQRIFLDHIHSLDADQRKIFGTNLINALNREIQMVKETLPPPAANEAPYSDAQLMGQQIPLIRDFAAKLENGDYSVDGPEVDALLQEDLAELCRDLNTEDKAEENSVFYRILIASRDPEAFARHELPDDAQYEIDRKGMERSVFFDRRPELETALGGRTLLQPDEIERKRAENRDARKAYAQRVAAILKKIYAGQNTKKARDSATDKAKSLFSSVAYNIGLKYRTGVDLATEVSHWLNRAGRAGLDNQGNANDVEALNRALTEAAEKIADADLYMQFERQLNGIEHYLDTGDVSQLDPDHGLVFQTRAVNQICQEAHSHADDIVARRRVAGRKSPEEIAELMFQGYLNLRGDRLARMAYLASANELGRSPFLKDDHLYGEALSVFIHRLIRYECWRDGAPDAEKYKQFVRDMAEFRFDIGVKLGEYQVFDEESIGISQISDNYSNFQASDFIQDMEEIATRLHLPLHIALQAGYMTLMKNSPEHAAKRSAFIRKEKDIPFADPAENRKKELFSEKLRDTGFLAAAGRATNLINVLGDAVFVDERDAGDIRNALAAMNKAIEEGLPAGNRDSAQSFTNQLREYSGLLDKAASDPLRMRNHEVNRMYTLQEALRKACVKYIEGSEQNPAPAEGDIFRDCIFAAFQVLRRSYWHEERTVMEREEPTAAQRIEREQAQIAARGGSPAGVQVARILAARQIAESVRGSRARLDERRVNPRELNETTAALISSRSFQSFMQQHANDPALLAAVTPPRHGGRLEDMFKGHILNLPAGQLPDSPYFARYMPAGADRIKVLRRQIRAMQRQPDAEALAKAAAEILVLRKACHAYGDDTKPLSAPVPVAVLRKIEALANNAAFRQLLSAQGGANLAANGLGRRLEERIFNAYQENRGNIDIPFLNTCTVNGRIGEICRDDALRLQNTLREAMASGDDETVAKVRQQYFTLMSELIALDEVAHAGSRDARIPWETVNQKISGIRGVKAYQSVMENVNADIMLSDLVNLTQDAELLDGDGVVAAMQTLEKNHRPWKNAADRINDEMRQIKATERLFLQQAAANRETLIRQYMNEAAQRDRELNRPAASRKQLRSDAEKRWEKMIYTRIAVEEKGHYARMLAAEQLAGGDANSKMSFRELQEMAGELERNQTVRDFLNSFQNDPKALHELSAKGDGAFQKAFRDYLLNLPANGLENCEVLSCFMPTYLERIEVLKKQEALAKEEELRAVRQADALQRKADAAVAGYCRANNMAYRVAHHRAAAEDSILRAADDADGKEADHVALNAQDQEARKTRSAIQEARRAQLQAIEARENHALTSRRAAAEIIALRNMAHAGRKEKSRLEQPISADGAISLLEKTNDLNNSAAFQELLTDGVREALQSGNGGEMYLRLAERCDQKLNNLREDERNREGQYRAIRDILKSNTVGARLKEIRELEAWNLSRQLENAQEAHNEKAVAAVAESYKKLLVEVIVLNGVSQNGGADQAMNHKSIDRTIEQSEKNESFIRMTRNLNAEKLSEALNSLQNDDIQRFLTRQAAANAEHANAAVPQGGNQPQNPVAQGAQPGLQLPN